jgi:multimeric flavodoxin WrbA
MKVMAFNGSPRKKNWNTVTLLQKALQGAQSTGAEIELVQLYDLNFGGCLSCFSCKKLDRKEDGVCALQDDLTAVLLRVKQADALIIGTPVYYSAESSKTRALLERLCYPYLKYAKDGRSLFPRKIKTGLIYTMNVSEEIARQRNFFHTFETTRGILARHFGTCELFLATDTRQYDDYDQFEAEIFDKEAKLKRHAEVFPEDSQRAFALGVRLATVINPESN